MIEKLTKETDLLNNDPLKADPLKNDPYSPEASQQVDHFYKDWGVALSPEKRAGSEAYRAAVDESVNKQKGILGQYTKDFNKQFGAANASANSALAGIEAKKPKLVPFSVWSDGWGKMEQTYYITEDAAKQVMDEVNKEKKGLVATWEGGYRINSKGYGKEIHEALGDAERQTQGAMKAYETAVGGARDSVNIQRESALDTHAGNVGLANQGIAATQNLWTRHLNDMRTAFQAGVQNNSAGIGALVQSGALVFSGKVSK